MINFTLLLFSYYQLILKSPLEAIKIPHWKAPIDLEYEALVIQQTDRSFSCVVKTQRRWSKKIYKTELTNIRYNNQVLCKSRVDPQRAGLTLIKELTWSNLGLKGVLNKRK